MRKLTLLIFIGFLPSFSAAQIAHAKWKIGVNPLGLAEPQATLGFSAEYRLIPRIGIWGEASYIFNNSYLNRSWKQVKGYRVVLQTRYYILSRNSLFITPEIRFKNFSYRSTGNFLNTASGDTLFNLPFKATQQLIGGAFVVGKQWYLSKNKNFSLEFTAGIGAKKRNINRRNIPEGYQYNSDKYSFGLSPHTETDKEGAPYFPIGLRLIWQIKN